MYRKNSYHESSNVQIAKGMLNEGIPMFVFDLETTGLSKKTDHILSFSAIRLVKKNGTMEEDDRMDLFINPGFPIPPAITKINHISDETVKGCPKEAEAARMIRSFLGENPLLCGYNSVSFDEGFLQTLYGRVFGEALTPCLHLDVYRMAKEKLNLSSYKLCNVSEYLGADDGLEFHNSIDDVIATTRSLIMLLDMYEDSEKEQKMNLKVRRAKYWESSSSKLKRIYVNTDSDACIYYDLRREEWMSDLDIDMLELRKAVFDLYHVTDEAELVKKIKEN